MKKQEMAKKMKSKGQHFKPEDDFEGKDLKKEKAGAKEKYKNGHDYDN